MWALITNCKHHTIGTYTHAHTQHKCLLVISWTKFAMKINCVLSFSLDGHHCNFLYFQYCITKWCLRWWIEWWWPTKTWRDRFVFNGQMCNWLWSAHFQRLWLLLWIFGQWKSVRRHWSVINFIEFYHSLTRKYIYFLRCSNAQLLVFNQTEF